MSGYPSLQKQLNNLKGSFANLTLHMANKNYRKLIKVPREVFKERMSICNSCNRYDIKNHRCMECGCFVGLTARIGYERCPLNKWGAVDEVPSI